MQIICICMNANMNDKRKISHKSQTQKSQGLWDYQTEMLAHLLEFCSIYSKFKVEHENDEMKNGRFKKDATQASRELTPWLDIITN